jgi:hypothetical protein
MDYQTDGFEDKEIECSDCHQEFTFTGGEQRFYEEREYTPPKRCKPCREQRKAQREARDNY